MTDPTDTHGVSSTLPGDLYQRLVAEADAEDRNVSAHVRRIIRDHFRRQDVDTRRRNLTDEVRPTIGPAGESMTVTRDDAVHRPWDDR